MSMPSLDPALEIKRERGLLDEAKKRQSQEEDADKLATSLNRVHASFLFLRKHEIAVQQFCRHLDATSPHIQNNSWNALVVELGLDNKIIGCVHNMKEVSFTELILKSFASLPHASLGTLVNAIKKIDRLDAFLSLQGSLEAISAEYTGRRQNEDSGFSSVDTETTNESQTKLVYPDFTEVRAQWKKGLPFTLRHLQVDDLLGGEDEAKIHEPPRVRHREENRVQGATIIPTRSNQQVALSWQKSEAPSCKVIITFAEDGRSLAKEITKILRTSVGKRPPIGVLVLDEHWERVQRNPEEFIMNWFGKVNYVIPILTEGYLNLIRKKHQSGSDLAISRMSLDVEYVPFIKDLANKYYTANSCMNDKVRCVVPINRRSVLNHMRCKVDPLMKSYVYDTEVEGLARRMTRTFNNEEDE